MALRTQAVAPTAAGLLAGITAFYWVPSHYQWWIYTLSAAPTAVMNVGTVEL